jgi:Flp pilus assembly protein TadD
MAELACQLTGKKDAAKLKTLAAAYAETGRFKEARDLLQRAMALAADPQTPVDLPKLQRMLEAIEAGKPWRE